MKILQAGMAKSGNLWLYNTLKSLLTVGNIPTGSFIKEQAIYKEAKNLDLSFPGQAAIDVLDLSGGELFYRISSFHREKIEDVDKYLERCTLIWTHSEFDPSSIELYGRIGRTVYIVRDPRDMLISHANFAFTTYFRKYYPHDYVDVYEFLEKTLEGKIEQWKRHVGGYLQKMTDLDFHIVFYERMLVDYDREVERLGKYLGITVGRERIAVVKEETDFTRMKKINPSHVRKGARGEWRTTLTNSQKRKVDALAGNLLKLLGYPSSLSIDDDSLPRIPEGLTASSVKKAMKEGIHGKILKMTNTVIGKLRR